MFINLTKHNINVYDLCDVQVNRYNPSVCYLKNINAKPNVISEFNRPVNVHYFPINDLSISVDRIEMKGNISYCSGLDSLPVNINYGEDIIIISGIYAEVAKNHLIQQPELLDILYTPADKVLDINKNNIGCTALRKVGNYLLPSYYMNYHGNEYSKKLALKYWNVNRNLLNVYELNCLNSLYVNDSNK